MKMLYLLFCFPLLFSSCSVYHQHFDSPPDPGTPRTSVTDLEQMILEMPIGPDIFLGCDACSSPPQAACRRKIWINTCQRPDGTSVPGHYIYVR